MSKKLKTTTTKPLIVKICIFAILILTIAAIIIISGTIRTKDRYLFTNAADEEVKECIEIIDENKEETEPSEKEKNIDEIKEDKNADISDKIYTVISGDSYSKICKLFYNNEDLCWALMEWNSANGNSALDIGKELKIPNLNNEEFANIVKTVKRPIYTPKIEIKNEVKKEQAINKTVEYTSIEEETSAEEQPIQQTSTTNNSAPKTSGNVRNNPGYVDTSNFTYLGQYRITGYTPGCYHCCGNTKGITASGVPAVVGRTIAAKGFSFGQTLYIKGYGFYVVEDRGSFGSGTIDMAAGSHNECYSITASGVDVYLVPNN